MTLYVLRLHEPLARKDGGAQYYLGYTSEEYPINRLRAHAQGKGSRFTQVALERGISWDVVLILPGDSSDERRIKNQGSIRRFLQNYYKRQGYTPYWLEKGLIGSAHGRY